MIEPPGEEEPLTREDAQVIRTLRKITAKGYNAEVRQKKDGSLQVYEVKKNIVPVGQ